MTATILEVRKLVISAGEAPLIDDVSFAVRRGELLAVVGASGAGKSLSGRAMVGLVPFLPGVVSGEVRVLGDDGTALVTVPSEVGPARERALKALRGRLVGWIPQDARAALSPIDTVGRQVADALRHAGRPHDRDSMLEALAQAGFPQPAVLVNCYPHTLSGGMARRVQVALGLSTGAPFLVADEPTTGLDRPVQARLVQTLRRLCDGGLGLVWITHELGLVRRFADHVVVLERGCVVRKGPATEVIDEDSL